jgi:DNA-binding NarL/FixJ family response regulator
MAQEMTPDAGGAKKRIFIVDDHPLVREWLANLINRQSDIKVCGEAGSASEGLRLIARANPHVAIVDISMEGGSGVELIENIKATHPEVAIVVLSMHDESLYAERALRAGARGYIMKREATGNVLQAVRLVIEGKFYLSKKMANVLTEKFVEGKPPVTGSLVEVLSARELEVFQLLGRNYSTRQVAEKLRISVNTVQSFCARIKEKLTLSSATELLREAVLWHDRQKPK